MSNKDLLKQAIAEAKTIREAAIANAKEALEETLTPHLKEMLAQKLQEMENDVDEEEKVMDENIYEAEEEEVEAEEEGAEEEAGEEKEGDEEEMEIEDMSVEDLKDLIKSIVAQEVGGNEEEDMMAGEEAPEGEEDMVSMDGDSEEIDINELLAELAKEDEMEEGKLGDFAKKVGDKVKATVGDGGKMDQFIDKTHARMKKAGVTSPYGANTQGLQEEEDTMDEGLEDWIDKMTAKLQKAGKNSALVQAMEKAISKYETEKHSGANKIAEQESEDLAEALATVKQLRTQLQEVNLLNAKLLYVNKVFKSNNLSEGQKVNVIAAFDKAETVKEVKLVFETVSKNVVTKPATIKEHRSFASKATGNATTTAPKEIISEVSETVKRMQKLAGIIK